MKRNDFRTLILLILSYSGFFIFLFSTDPQKIAIGWLILPFIWLFTLLFFSVLFVARWLSPNSPKKHKQLMTALLVALIPTLLLILNSVSRLTFADTILTIGFSALAIFYIAKVKVN